MTALIFDTETHKLHGDIIEAAAVGVSFHGQILLPTCYEFKKRYKPSEPIGLGAMAVHHIVAVQPPYYWVAVHVSLCFVSLLLAQL